MTHTEDLAQKRWEELFKRDDLKGAQLFFETGPRYVGEIESWRVDGARAVFTFAWTAAETQRGWTRRKRVNTTIYLRDVPREDGERRYLAGSVTLIFAGGTGWVNKDGLVNPLTHSQRERERSKKSLPLFSEQ